MAVLTAEQLTAAGVDAQAFESKTVTEKVMGSVLAGFSGSQEAKWASWTGMVIGAAGMSLAIGLTDGYEKLGPFAYPSAR